MPLEGDIHLSFKLKLDEHTESPSGVVQKRQLVLISCSGNTIL